MSAEVNVSELQDDGNVFVLSFPRMPVYTPSLSGRDAAAL
jgi:hypothetical protein